VLPISPSGPTAYTQESYVESALLNHQLTVNFPLFVVAKRFLLSLKYNNPDVYYDIANKLELAKDNREKYVEEFKKEVSEQLKEEHLNFTIKGRAKEILDVLGMGHRLKHYPSQLSGGEAQRVALARALVVRPKILLADEPTGSLDPKTGQKIMDYFFQICRQFQTTAILVTHNMDFAQKCDRSVHLNAANAPRGAAK
jgi:ABC-type methionine transport system ATPase subunit